jgi:hypothetical protein
VHLSDLAHLPRPGDAGESWQGFIECPLVRGLNWPKDVVEQFLFDHGTNPDFLDQYGHLSLETLNWPLEELPATEFARVTWTVDRLGARVEECESSPEGHIGLRLPDQRARWSEAGTWVVPPLLIDASLLRPPRSGLHIVEGHTRIGILRGLLAAGVADRGQTHSVYVGRSPGDGEGRR